MILYYIIYCLYYFSHVYMELSHVVHVFLLFHSDIFSEWTREVNAGCEYVHTRCPVMYRRLTCFRHYWARLRAHCDPDLFHAFTGEDADVLKM